MASPCDAYLHAVKFAAMMIEALSEKAGCACVCQPESASLLCQSYAVKPHLACLELDYPGHP